MKYKVTHPYHKHPIGGLAARGSWEMQRSLEHPAMLQHGASTRARVYVRMFRQLTCN